MVSGGTYGTEDIIGGAGYHGAILVLVLTPLLWSLPTALMVGELGSSLPDEGGYYAWVRRGLGSFWGFQEAWLSLVASIFDMALYPTLVVVYLKTLIPALGVGHRGLLVGLAVITVCTVLNILGVQVVALSSIWLFAILSAPFVAIVLLAPFKIGALAHVPVHPTAPSVGLLGGMVIAMWNYMGWDSASTIATEVREPQKAYPRAMIGAVLLVAMSYILPVLAMRLTGISSAAFSTGSWSNLARLIGGPALQVALAVGGVVSAFGMFNALVMSYCRLPLAMAQDGLLPNYFMRVHPRSRAPWVAIVVCAVAWALCLGLGFERLITLDVLLSGASVVLEFAALVALRVREPELARPFRVPGGLAGAVLIGICTTLLLGVSVAQSAGEKIGNVSGLVFSAILIVAGFAVWFAVKPSMVEEANELAAESTDS
jgi:amino acid transporter